MSKEGDKGIVRTGIITWMKPHIFVDEPYGLEAIEFYKAVFGAVEVESVYEKIDPNDEIKGKFRVISCELQLGSTCIFVSEHIPDSPWFSKRKVGYGTSRGIIHVYVKDVASVVSQAVNLGAICNLFDENDRVRAKFTDPYGVVWYVRRAYSIIDSTAKDDSTAEDEDRPLPQTTPVKRTRTV